MENRNYDLSSLKLYSDNDEYRKNTFYNHQDNLERAVIENLNVHLAYHCNLNCAGCCCYCPIADKKLPDKDTITKDLKRISFLTKDNPITNIVLFGGEPLLNPDLIYFIYLSRELFPNSNVSVFSNGILVLKQPDEFWKALHNINGNLVITRYFKNEDFYEKILKVAEEFNVRVDYADSSKQAGTVLFTMPKMSAKQTYYVEKYGDKMTREDAEKIAWEHCVCKNNCISLDNGKLYSCQKMAMLKWITKQRPEFELYDDDAVDIYKVNTYKEVIEELRKPKKSCWYCLDPNYDGALYLVKRSTGDIHEWVRDD